MQSKPSKVEGIQVSKKVTIKKKSINFRRVFYVKLCRSEMF